MYLVLRTGLTTNGPDFVPGDIVDWPNEEAKRLIEKGFAEEATKEEIQAAGRKAKKYSPPVKRPEDAWPPKQKSALRNERGRIDNTPE